MAKSQFFSLRNLDGFGWTRCPFKSKTGDSLSKIEDLCNLGYTQIEECISLCRYALNSREGFIYES